MMRQLRVGGGHERDGNSQISMGRDSSTCSLKSEISQLDSDDSDAVPTLIEDAEIVMMPGEPLDEDMYGMIVCSLVRDLYFVEAKLGTPSSRFARVATTLLLLLTCISLQVYLLTQVKSFVTARAVHDIRDAYDLFEKTMYSEYEFSVNGKHRGVGEIRSAAHFYNISVLTEKQQAKICRIPLSQPLFFFNVLFIWTLTCLIEFRQCASLFQSMIFRMKSTSSMAYALKAFEEQGTDHIMGLTRSVKGVILFLVIIPRMFITSILLWLGCRWLLATDKFSDLILNAVALEFVLVLKELVFRALVPARNKYDLGRTLVHEPRQEQTHLAALVATCLWGIVGAVWVVLYMGVPRVLEGFQQVLPGYKWDVHDICTAFLKWRYCVNPPCPASPLDAYVDAYH
eukprot:TRINITY_DN11702_c0_g1_i1.p1 TRINITY_DN11702_c0_g1~~TRINITY_DN11702_c0_g1_i1.p1  ORF type:complete len:399 (-),score=35.88 TRINITY_DN11702_c0_g1_i1:239-1435(-)